ncbi:MAG TPA: Cro/Cl family transcriptional regulator [Candidatus Ruania gallistercoris]|uniref:Cro/Cl family transcriptional regulator n=1 Tax=Candidatus Ruania gallistercoris TaxID=2838746 RepID=A0A9D2ECY5_9MICO|nr:Cro/Cl family transcriptional regulator [Candidatus Ruania gallistercoris]
MDRDELVLMRDVSVDFHVHGKSKVEIADARNLSRFRVARLLNTARELGIVRISIELPEESEDLSEPLARSLGVPVTIAPSHSEPGQRRDLLARTLARTVRDHVQEGMTVGFSWSRTLETAAVHLDQLPPCEVVQLVGAQPVEGSGDSMGLIQHFKAIPGVRTWPIWAPLTVGDASTAAGLRAQPQIARALRKADELDLAVVAIGGWSPQSSTVYPTLSAADLAAIKEHSPVGECSGRLFDADGLELHAPLEQRVVAVQLEQLRRTPTVIASGFGKETAAAVHAAVHGGFADILVLDAECAGALIEMTGTG